MGNRWKKWFAVVMATVLGMPGYGLVAEHIQTKAEDGSVTIHVESEERHVQVNETISLIDGVSVEGPSENGEAYRVVVKDIQEQDSGLSLYEEGMEEFTVPQEAAGKTYHVLYQAQSSSDNETWNDVEGVEKEVLLVVDQEEAQQEVNNEETTEVEENKEVKETEGTEKTEEKTTEEKEEPKVVSVTLQGKEKEEAEVGEVFSFLHDNNVIMHIPEEDEKDYRIIVRGVDTPENGSYSYKEGDTSFVPQKGDEGLTYIVHYGVDINKDDESHDNQWEQVEGVSFDKEVIVTDKVIIQGEEEITVLAGEEYNFIHDSGLVVKGAKEEGTTYRLKVKGVKSPDGGSYSYQEGDESFIPQESDEGLIYEVTYGAETSKDQTTWEEVDKVQFTQKIITAVFRPEPVRGPLATEAILCTGQQFRNFVKYWNTGSSIKVRNLVKADVPSDLMTATLRYKYETISDPTSPVKIYMWHDMSAVGQYTDTVYFGTEVPGVTIYTNPDASSMFYGNHDPYYDEIYLDKIYDSANPSTPYFFNTSKTTDMSYMFSSSKLPSRGIPFDCTNGNGVSPLGLMDTSNATNLEGMFFRTENIDLSGIETWNVHNVQNISNMFSEVVNLNIPWGIGNWEFDNLTNVNGFLENAQGSIELNIEKWDLSHCDASNMFQMWAWQLTITRLKIGAKHIDRNGKAFFPPSKPRYNSPGPTDTVYNGTWENEATGQQYFQCMAGEDSGYREFIRNNVSQNEFSELGEAYVTNPIGISGVYKRGEGHCIFYRTDASSAADDRGFQERVLYYKKSDTTATLINNPYTWAYHYFKKWEETLVSPHELKNEGDTVPLNRNYEFKVVWGVNERTITYDLDGGVNNPYNPAKFIVGEGKEIYEPTKSGMIFAGWTWTSASKSMPDPWYIRYSTDGGVRSFPDEDVVLKAHWVLPRTITIHGNGGTITYPSTGTDFSTVIPNANDIKIKGRTWSDGATQFTFEWRGKELFYTNVSYDNHIATGLHDSNGIDVFNGALIPENYDVESILPLGTNDFYMQWRLIPKNIKIQFNSVLTSPYSEYIMTNYVAPDGSQKTVRVYSYFDFFKEYTGKQWDETSPNMTLSIKGHETGAPNEYVFDNFEEVTPSSSELPRSYVYQSFTISSPGSSHTYPTGNLTSYTFTGGFDKDVTITFNLARAWRVQYVNLDDTPITTMQIMTTADLPYTFRNTYPPHAPWHGFNVLPIGWTIAKYNQGSSDAEGVYTSTGNLPTLYRGTWDATQFDTVQSTLKLYPMYSVDVNKDGIPDLFQNKNTVTVSKEIAGEYFNHQLSQVFTVDVYFKDVHGDPIKNWPIQDTNGNTYTADINGKVTINLQEQEQISFEGMLPNMIIRAVETNTHGMAPEHAISYNGTSFTSGADTGNVTYQDNTPLTFAFRNVDNRTIVPAGIKDTNTRVYVLLSAVLIALLFSIRMLKRRRHA